MTGPMGVRYLYLFGQERWIAQAMEIAVELFPPPPYGPCLGDVIDIASRTFLCEIEDACDLAGLDDVQSETLIENSRRGIEAFTTACGMAMLEQIRSGTPETTATRCYSASMRSFPSSSASVKRRGRPRFPSAKRRA